MAASSAAGGTGQDGVIGDDGRIYTSRNNGELGLNGELLNNIDPLLTNDTSKYADGNVLDEFIKTPGNIQTAIINRSGELKKTVNITPFSFDPSWGGMDDEFPDTGGDTPWADDIIFGGLGPDFLHGGSGDDAISGAEALDHAYVPTYNDTTGEAVAVLDLGYAVAGVTNTNPGDVLAYNPENIKSKFRAGEFALYDEYEPRREVLLTPDGELYKGTKELPDVEGVNYFPFLLNFDETEGVLRPDGLVPKATGQQTDTYPAVNDDGMDAIFGDLGNDWLVKKNLTGSYSIQKYNFRKIRIM